MENVVAALFARAKNMSTTAEIAAASNGNAKGDDKKDTPPTEDKKETEKKQ